MRVVEGPLFSEVVAHYQHFQQTVRIHNVPGTPSILQASICSAHKFDRVSTSCPACHITICLCRSGVDGLSLDITTMVDIRDQNNKELAMRLVTDIQSEDTFYTDLNGFQVKSTCLQTFNLSGSNRSGTSYFRVVLLNL